MGFDSDNFLDGLSDAPVDAGTWGDEWTPASEFPPCIQPSNQLLVVSDINELRGFEANGTSHLEANLNFRVLGGEQDGVSAATFVRLNTFVNQRSGQSRIGDMLNSAGFPAPASQREMAEFIKVMLDDGKECTAQIEWRGFCSPCYQASLMTATNANTPEAAKAELQGSDTSKAVYKAANAAGLKARNARAFPDSSNGDGKQDFFSCGTCGNEVRAQTRIARFLKS